MYFKQFLHDETGCSSYLIASRSSREAVVVDPQYDIQPYLDLAAERDYRIAHVIDTHLHADHLSGNRRLAAATGAGLWLHESAPVQFAFEPLHGGDEVRVGQVVLNVLHTPGHRPEAISLLIINPAAQLRAVDGPERRHLVRGRCWPSGFRRTGRWRAAIQQHTPAARAA